MKWIFITLCFLGLTGCLELTRMEPMEHQQVLAAPPKKKFNPLNPDTSVDVTCTGIKCH